MRENINDIYHHKVSTDSEMFINKTYRSYCFITCIFLSPVKTHDFLTPNDTLNKPKRNAIIISEVSIAGITLLGLKSTLVCRL